MRNQIRYQLDTNQMGVLVEKKALLSSENIEMHFYETIAQAEKVKMQFGLPVIAVMVKGEKIIDMDGYGKFQYTTGQSLIIPPEKKLSIDFPSASINNPAQCLAFVPDKVLIEEAVYDFHEKTNFSDVDLQKEVDFSEDLLMRDKAILQTVNYLMFLFQEHNEHRDLFINMTTKELVIRILQSKTRKAFLNHFHKDDNRMAHIARYINSNISGTISIKELAQEAGMSKSNFFTLFRNAFGLTPNEYIIQEKIEEAKKMIRTTPTKSIGQVAIDLGYSNSSYFIKQFKSATGHTPKHYAQTVIQKTGEQVV